MITCFAPQLRDVSRHFPQSKIRAVMSASQLTTLGVFVYVTPHLKLVAPALINRAKELGYIIIHVDEDAALDYLARRSSL